MKERIFAFTTAKILEIKDIKDVVGAGPTERTLQPTYSSNGTWDVTPD